MTTGQRVIARSFATGMKRESSLSHSNVMGLPERPALVTGSLSRRAGGMFYSARIPANRMAGRGLDLSVHGLADEDWPSVRDEWSVHRISAYPTLGPPRLGISPAMLRGLHAGGHDLLHLRGLWGFPSYAVAQTRAENGARTIISPEGMLDGWALSRSRLKKRAALALFERSNLAQATVLHALNATEAQDMRRFGLVNPIAVIPNGVDLPHTRRIGRFADARRTMLFLGRIHPKKGLRELIDGWHGALQIAPAIRTQWRLVIAGWDDGGHLAGLTHRVRDLGLEDVIEFPGGVFGTDKDVLLREASAYVLPSFGEGLPLGVLEGWAHELPVFMTDACNLLEGFEADAAVRIPPSAEMAPILARYLTGDPARLMEIGANGFALAARRFMWDAIVDQYLDLYRWAAAGGVRPRFVETD